MEEKNTINIEVKSEIANGKYSNLAIISHSHSEFVIDFAAMLPGMPKPDVVSRIIMNPEHAKRLLSALNDNIRKYESQFGAIEIPGSAPATFNMANLNGTKS